MSDPTSKTSVFSQKRFYRNGELVAVISPLTETSILKIDTGDLAQLESSEGAGSKLLVTDPMRNVLGSSTTGEREALSYGPYGFSSSHLSVVPGYTGQPREALGWYFLGRGTRIYAPVLMRCYSPDDLSPFGKGGINCYAYVENDPINYTDPTGHVKQLRYSGLGRKLGTETLYFESIEGGKRIGNIDMHGRAGLASFSGRMVNGKQLKAELIRSKIQLEDLDGFRLISCLSADGATPLAQQFANSTNLPTYGFKGPVFPTDHKYKLVRKNSDAVMIDDYSLATENPFRRSDPEYKNFAYEEQLFMPEKKRSKLSSNAKKIRAQR